jgi:hypothetical protein
MPSPAAALAEQHLSRHVRDTWRVYGIDDDLARDGWTFASMSLPPGDR